MQTEVRQKDGGRKMETEGRLEWIAPATIAASHTNPRKGFKAETMAELKASIQARGMVQPLVVRPVTSYFVDEVTTYPDGPKNPKRRYRVLDRRYLDPKLGYSGVLPKEEYATKAEAEATVPRFELVCGERRWRAASELGAATVPAIVRTDLDDGAAAEMQQMENLQREDLTALEEGEGFRALVASGRYTAEALAVKLGKSKAHVYSRLKLVALPESVKAAVRNGTLNGSIADLVARIPGEKNQEKAAKAILEEGEYDYDTGKQGTMSYREAKDYVQETWTLDLKKAVFDTTAADLLAGVGNCTTCPKRTGNCRELFPDIKSADVCTDPECYHRKAQADVAAKLAAAQAKGQETLTAAQSKKVWDRYSGPTPTASGKSGYVDPAEHCALDPKGRTFAELLGKELPKPVAAVDPKGKVRQLCRTAAVTAALKAKKFPWLEKAENDRAADQKKHQVERERTERREEMEPALRAELRMKLEKLPTDSKTECEFWKCVLGWVDNYGTDEVLAMRGIKGGLEKAMKGMTLQQLRCLALEATVLGNDALASQYNGGDWDERFVALCELAGLDLKRREKELTAQQEQADPKAKTAPDGKKK